MRNIFTLLLILPLFSSAQPYTVTWFQDTYDSLQNPNSIITDFGLTPDISYEDVDLPFGFNFPYFGNLETEVYLEGSAYGSIGCDPEYNFNLFASDYTGFQLTSGGGISDWRYVNDFGGTDSILKVEWNNVGITEHIEDGLPFDHTINFQYWFYGDGTIELRFGEIDVENTNYYTTGQGFLLGGEPYGPWIEIANCDFTEYVNVIGTHPNPTVNNDSAVSDIFYNIPPEGWVIRFAPGSVSVPEADQNLDFGVRQSDDAIFLFAPSNARTWSASLMGLDGRVAVPTQGGNPQQVVTRGLAAGIYLLEIESEGRRSTHKVWVRNSN